MHDIIIDLRQEKYDARIKKLIETMDNDIIQWLQYTINDRKDWAESIYEDSDRKTLAVTLWHEVEHASYSNSETYDDWKSVLGSVEPDIYEISDLEAEDTITDIVESGYEFVEPLTVAGLLIKLISEKENIHFPL